jgi:hypothetical protein
VVRELKRNSDVRVGCMLEMADQLEARHRETLDRFSKVEEGRELTARHEELLARLSRLEAMVKSLERGQPTGRARTRRDRRRQNAPANRTWHLTWRTQAPWSWSQAGTGPPRTSGPS